MLFGIIGMYVTPLMMRELYGMMDGVGETDLDICFVSLSVVATLVDEVDVVVVFVVLLCLLLCFASAARWATQASSTV